MLLGNLFRREKAPEPKQIEFDIKDPMFEGIPTIPGTSILAAGNRPALSVLARWLSEHDNSAKYVYFYAFPKLPENYHQMKRVALRSQIMKGMSLVMKLETFFTTKDTRRMEIPIHPHPNLLGIYEADITWRDICANEVAIHELKCQLDEVAFRRSKELKITAASLVSLLASLDCIPENYIPVLELAKLDISQEMMELSDPLGRILHSRVDCYRKQNETYKQMLVDIASRYAPVGDMITDNQIQCASFNALLREYQKDYDSVNHCMNRKCNSVLFLDFLLHPNCFAVATIQTFLHDRSVANLKKLINELITVFEPKGDIRLLIALCCHTLAPHYSPELTTLGSMTAQCGEDVFELFTEHDPIRFLVLLADLCKGNANRLRWIIEGLSGMTPDYRAIFNYVLDFTLEEYLADHLKPVRQVIAEAFASK